MDGPAVPDPEKGLDVILATIPYKQKFSPGSEVLFKVGSKKMAAVDEMDFFAMCVGKMDKTTCTTPSGENPVAVSDDSSGIRFKFPPMTKITNRGDISLSSAIMEIPSETDAGTYGFRIYVCAMEQASGVCNGLQDSYGSYDFIVQVA